MITAFFILIFTTIANFIVNLLPVYAMPSDWASALTTILGYAYSVSYLFPLGTLFTILSISVFLDVSIWLWHMSLKVYHMIRG